MKFMDDARLNGGPFHGVGTATMLTIDASVGVAAMKSTMAGGL